MNLAAARVVGFFSLPGPSLAQANPTAYSLAMAAAPAGAGTCAHCGTGIFHHVIISTPARGIEFIGTTCAEKAGGHVARCVATRSTSAAIEKVDRLWDEVRERQQEAELARRAAERARRDRIEDLIVALNNQGTNFHDSLADQFKSMPLSPRQARFATNAVIGRRSKKIAGAWDSTFDRFIEENP